MEAVWGVVRAGGVCIAEEFNADSVDPDGCGGTMSFLIMDQYFQPWSPDSPFLYDLTLKVGEDLVHSYFAMRKWSCEADAKGIMRFCPNDKPILLNGLLDQGYWPDGLYTPPSPPSSRG